MNLRNDKKIKNKKILLLNLNEVSCCIVLCRVEQVGRIKGVNREK